MFVSPGITEYEAFGFKTNQMLLGIPWHGYNYTCDNYEEAVSNPCLQYNIHM